MLHGGTAADFKLDSGREAVVVFDRTWHTDSRAFSMLSSFQPRVIEGTAVRIRVSTRLMVGGRCRAHVVFLSRNPDHEGCDSRFVNERVFLAGAAWQRVQRTNPLGTVTDIVFQFPASWKMRDAQNYLRRTIPGLNVQLKQAQDMGGDVDRGRLLLEGGGDSDQMEVSPFPISSL